MAAKATLAADRALCYPTSVAHQDTARLAVQARSIDLLSSQSSSSRDIPSHVGTSQLLQALQQP
ncbi:hypothetical protein COCC4DRAFT_127174 [Bipolaris maydis ATCC 48331]|uniref:Uncharacterized protein n=2 Tax=Cochliobolus heterostrophus TaxID=5016 RepID=M2TUG9_COCH5|nr:uncharacterized protein COCC4DRAFT_127174 [Bipolaris maydis ATCC 48331]EMD90179.1 hypothetical protein COCHEDRAFT_1215195 [Bipolaris maydis C5]ENI09610.1 hypothetical protein COCC4DRAFT_127174 [Bipolaris maydis ATCC 48331]